MNISNISQGQMTDIIKDAVNKKYSKNSPIIENRLNEELAAIERLGVMPLIVRLYEITEFLKENKIPYWMRLSAASSFVLYILGVTRANPLEPHKYCPVCKNIYIDSFVKDGYDIPEDTVCRSDRVPFIKDGHNIPWQTLWGFGDKKPRFEMVVPLKNQDIINEHFSIKTDKELDVSSIKLIYSEDMNDIYENFYDQIPFDRGLMLSNYKLMLSDVSDHHFQKPDNIADLISLFGLSHGDGVWDSVTKTMYDEMGYRYSDLVAFCDDVYTYLSTHWFDDASSWEGMDSVRRGKGLPQSYIVPDLTMGTDKWVLSRCNRIKCLFSKAHAVEYMLFLSKIIR